MKTILTFLSLVLLVAGCGRSVMTYEQAQERFSVGMSPAEVKKAFGEPTNVLKEDEKTTSWYYSPLREVVKGAPGNYSGFAVVFSDGKTTLLAHNDIVKESAKPPR